MVELEIVTATGEQGGQPEWHSLARLRVDGDEVKIEGDRRALDFTMPVVSIRTGGQVRFEDDHEEWARSLPAAFRTGDVVVRVVHDDAPLRDEELVEADVERHHVRLGVRIGQRA